MNTPFRFHQGDRVKRPEDVFAEHWVYKFGTVVKAYSRWGVRISDSPPFDYPELYAVLWDHGEGGRGYLPHGVDPVNGEDRMCPATCITLPGRNWPVGTDERGNRYQDTKYGRACHLDPEVPKRPPLTQEELKSLPKGTRILVLWPGGGGPAEYVLSKWYGRPLANLKRQPGVTVGELGARGRDVGTTKYHTKVWLLEEAE